MLTDSSIGDIEVTGLPQIQSTPISSWIRMKAAINAFVAGILLVLTGPVILLCLLAVRISSKGPVFYSQRRLGLNGRSFTIYKIRTMYLDSERHHGPMWSGKGDPRVIPVGRILRASHLDELPQLFNVIAVR